MMITPSNFGATKNPTLVFIFKKYNGAIPIFNTFEFEGHEYLIERFLSILGDKINDIQEGWSDIEVITTQIDERLTRNGDKLGMDLIPIAALFAGDFICMDFVENPENPSICIWYHEQSAPFKPVIKRVAVSFDGFLEMLK